METEISKLKHRLCEAEHNTVLAATYGKQLLEKNQLLETQIEELQQEKHSLSVKLEASVKMELSLVQEVDSMREHQARHTQLLAAQAAHSHDLDIQKHTRKILDLESIVGSQRLEIAQKSEEKELLEAQLNEAQERLESFNNNLDQSVEDSTGLLQSQVTLLAQEKQDLETLSSSLKVQLATYKYRLEQAEKKVLELESALEEKECQFTSYYNALEKNKEEMMEMRMEIESLKMAETDPAKKGNSLFAEVEDHRQALERQLINYKTNYNIIKKRWELKTQEAAKLKLQLASLLSQSNNRASLEYVNHLEESLASTRSQLDGFIHRCKQLEETQQNMAVSTSKEGTDEEDSHVTEFFKNLYMESKKKITELNQSLHQAQFDKVMLNDRILELQRKLRQMESSRDVSSGQVLRLQLKLDDLMSKKGHKAESDVKVVKRVVEKLPDFNTAKSNTCTPNTELNQMSPQATQQQEQVLLLKEKLLDPITMQEVTKDTKNINNEDGQEIKSEGGKESGEVESEEKQAVKVENEENVPPIKHETKKKPKKTVQLFEKVTVQESDGQVQETKIKKEDGLKKLEKKGKPLRELKGPVIKVDSSQQVEECKTQ